MDSERFNVWLQLTGMAGIVASLIFVGLQLKQSQEIAIASQYAERSSEAREIWQGISENPTLLASYGAIHREHLKAALQYDDEMSDETVGLWYVSTRSYLASYDNNHYQYNSGFLSDDGWTMYKARILYTCAAGSWSSAILSSHTELFRPSFVELCLNGGQSRN